MTAILNSLAVSFDLPILDWIQAHLQCGFLDFLMPIITLFGDAGIFWMPLPPSCCSSPRPGASAWVCSSP